jgi:hypothetical protein
MRDHASGASPVSDIPGACHRRVPGHLRPGDLPHALIMLQAFDPGPRSYLEIAEVVERHSPQARKDLAELYRRMAFSALTGNTDDHLRNHGFLRTSNGQCDPTNEHENPPC